MLDVTQVMAQYGPSLGRVVAAYARTAADREDLAQDIALSLVQALRSYRAESSLRTYVLRVAHNCAIRHIARRRAASLPLDEAQHETRAPSPEHAASTQRDVERLAFELQRLPLGMRQVLSLLLEGLPQREIAEVLGLSENVVSVRLHRARKLLEQRMREQEAGHG
jgi:RNA polymerase sigma factor (sigma-70 family)